jgi:hypothetical protein
LFDRQRDRAGDGHIDIAMHFGQVDDGGHY